MNKHQFYEYIYIYIYIYSPPYPIESKKDVNLTIKGYLVSSKASLCFKIIIIINNHGFDSLWILWKLKMFLLYEIGKNQKIDALSCFLIKSWYSWKTTLRHLFIPFLLSHCGGIYLRLILMLSVKSSFARLSWNDIYTHF